MINIHIAKNIFVYITSGKLPLMLVPKKMDALGYQVVELRHPSGSVSEENVANIIAFLFTPTHLDDPDPPKDIWDPYSQSVVQHLDGDLTNNNITNLKWVDGQIDDPDEPIRNDYILNNVRLKVRGDHEIHCKDCETGEEFVFKSIRDAEERLGVHNVSRVINGSRKRSGKYTFWKE